LAYDKNRITQHIDIQATVFDLLGVDPKSTYLLGQSVFGITKSYAFNFHGILFILILV
jgi:arylsulfatase A-like enzyme